MKKKNVNIFVTCIILDTKLLNSTKTEITCWQLSDNQGVKKELSFKKIP